MPKLTASALSLFFGFLWCCFGCCFQQLEVGDACTDEDVVPCNDFAHVADTYALGVVVGEYLCEEGGDFVVVGFLVVDVDVLALVFFLDGIEHVDDLLSELEQAIKESETIK